MQAKDCRRELGDLAAFRQRSRPDARPRGGDDARDAVVSRIAVEVLGVEGVVVHEDVGPVAPRGLDVDALVAGDQHQLRSPIEVGAVVDVALSQHLEERFARLGMRNRLEVAREPIRERRVVSRPGRLAQVDLAAGGEAVGAGAPEIHVGECPVRRRPRHERDQVKQPAVPRRRPRQAAVGERQLAQPPAQEPLERPAPVAQMPGPAEPLVGVERPVDRLHPVIGHHDRGRLLAVALSGRVDQLSAHAVDGLVDLHELVARGRRVVGGMGRIEARVPEVAGEVGAHEVDGEHAQVGLELEARPAGVDRSGRHAR